MSRETAETPTARFTGFEAIPLMIVVNVGCVRCSLSRLAELKPGEVIRLDRRIGEPMELRAGNEILALVEPVAEDDGIALKLVGIPEEDDATDC